MESKENTGLMGSLESYEDILIRGVDRDDFVELESIDTGVFGTLAYPTFVLRQFMDVHGESLLVAASAGGLCGYSLGAATIDHGEGWLLALAVRDEFRGRGYGRALTTETLKVLRRHRVRTACLTVAPGNVAALGLYRSLGFTPLREVEDYLGTGEDRVIMSCDLVAGEQQRA
ncbi:MAG TPA: N-acetyltransferase [Pseudonocardiaceae bacterium]|jgi:ribosomal protein S18 acetylase RimI-like enzyme|nr:N-acetyltransferase [Pseudonocardiaceae bacterium]